MTANAVGNDAASDAQLILHDDTDDREDDPKALDSPGRLKPRNFLSFTTVSWMNRLFSKGMKNPLTEKDLPSLPENERYSHSEAVLDGYWENCRTYWDHSSEASRVKPSIARVLFFKFWRYFFGGLILQAVLVATALLQPLLIPQSLNSFLEIQLNGIIVSAIYRKSLFISPKARKDFNAGYLNSLVGTDTNTIVPTPKYLINLTGNVVQFSIAIGFVFMYLGLSAFAPVALLAALITFEIKVMPHISGGIKLYNQGMDSRSKVLREFLYGVKFIKFQAIEDVFQKKMQKFRMDQILANVKIMRVFGLYFCSGSARNYMVATLSILIYALFNPNLSATIVFTTLALLDAVVGPAGSMNMTIGQLIKAPVSYKRIEDYLLAEETLPSEKPAAKPFVAGSSDSIKLSNAEFTWESVKGSKPKPPASAASAIDSGNDEPSVFKLKSIDLTIPQGSLVAIVGKVGSGKSSLLSSLVGGMRKTGGEAVVQGSVAYCPQEPWIMSGSVEDNIIFGDASVRGRIPRAIQGACLQHDLEIMPHGLGTRIGEKGVNLSGGQKARVSLARALARSADVYILDDPTSSLDAHVGKYVFESAICGMTTHAASTERKTVIMATHQLHLLPKFDLIIVMEDGKVSESGTFKDLLAPEDGVLSNMMRDYAYDDHEESKPVSKIEEKELEAIAKTIKNFEIQEAIAEDRRSGTVSMGTILSYFRAGGYSFLPVVALLVATLIAITSFNRIFLAIWTRDSLHLSSYDYCKIYLVLGVVSTINIAALIFFIINRAKVASISIHENALRGLISAPVSFFDDQPVGRILNRMTSDIREYDGNLPLNSFVTFREFSYFMTSAVMVAYSAPYVLIQFMILVPLAMIFFFRFQKSYRELKRLSSIMKSPLLTHVSESFNGTTSINAYGAQSHFVKAQQEKMDRSNAASLYLESATIWLGLRLSLLTSTIVLVMILLGAWGIIDGISIGLGLTGAIGLGYKFNQLLICISNTEATLNCAERLNHYVNDLPKEDAQTMPDDPAPGTWPSKGQIGIQNLELAYESRPDHSVLRNLSISIDAGEKIGIVGRTGSGKSSLASAFFRIINITSGLISIDGRDISKLGLLTLRSNLQIVPQEPVIFNGTVRSNLDMRDSHSDDELWASLDAVGLKEYVSLQSEKLDHPIQEEGRNLSAGQRQLLCVARSLLANPKILLLDEATASLDGEGNDRIQAILKRELKSSTVISVAHHIKTVAAFDKILVLQDGQMVEFDTPYSLLETEGSIFRSLAEAAGPASFEVIKALARGK
ncbi:Multidrug resistance-associated protein 1 [Phlyctochytrium planicorne]|nr:Multidrug resistance-associated protein 1 [Phlyctochytrium planicorne]